MERIPRDESDILELTLRMSAHEALAAGFAEITTAHLLIALSRVTDGEAATLAPVASTALREEFEMLGIEPKRFRRRLRALLGNAGAEAPAGVIHRSVHCKSIFDLAVATAAREHGSLSLSHFLRAILCSLAVNLAVVVTEIECPTCHAKTRPILDAGTPRCSKCGSKLSDPVTPAPDEIPDEL